MSTWKTLLISVGKIGLILLFFFLIKVKHLAVGMLGTMFEIPNETIILLLRMFASLINNIGKILEDY